jgi:hypothetical protein
MHTGRIGIAMLILYFRNSESLRQPRKSAFFGPGNALVEPEM